MDKLAQLIASFFVGALLMALWSYTLGVQADCEFKLNSTDWVDMLQYYE